VPSAVGASWLRRARNAISDTWMR